MPQEILLRIFNAALTSTQDPYSLIILPIILSHVSRDWRQTALSAAELWSHIVLSLHDRSVSRLEAWLHRSHNRLLTLYLDFRDPDWNWDEDEHYFGGGDMEHMLSHLLPHVSRWKDLEILADTWEPIHTFLRQTRFMSAPSLQSLSLSRCNAYFMYKGQMFLPLDLRSSVPLFLGGLPNLQKLNLVGVHVDWNHLQFPNLQELELKYHVFDVMPTWDEFSGMFRNCPHVEYLSIQGWGPQLDSSENLTYDQAIPTLTLPRVARFNLGFLDGDYANTMLRHLCLPNLDHLSLQNMTNGTSESASIYNGGQIPDLVTHTTLGHLFAAHHFLPFSASNLQRLDLHAIRTTFESTFSFLAALPNLRTLVLTQNDHVAIRTLSPFHMSATDRPSSVQVLCPKLSSLTCQSFDGLSILMDVLIDRGQACAILGHVPLKTVSVILPTDGRMDVSDAMWDSLGRLGTHLNVTFESQIQSGRRRRSYSSQDSIDGDVRCDVLRGGSTVS